MPSPAPFSRAKSHGSVLPLARPSFTPQANPQRRLFRVWLVAAIIVGIVAILCGMKTASRWSNSQERTIAIIDGPHEDVVTATNRDNFRIAPLPSNDPSNGVIGPAFVETDVVDPDGYVGVLARASIRPGRAPRYRFAVHFRDASRNRVFSADSRFSDPNRELACAVPVPAGVAESDLTAFIPYTAFDLKSENQRLEMLPALFDSGDRLLVYGKSVTFTWQRGSFYVARVHFRAAEQENGDQILTVTVRSERHDPIDFSIVVRLKGAGGSVDPRHHSFPNAAGEHAFTSNGIAPAAKIVGTTTDFPILIPANVITPNATAEITCYDGRSHAWLARPISLKLP